MLYLLHTFTFIGPPDDNYVIKAEASAVLCIDKIRLQEPIHAKAFSSSPSLLRSES